MIQTEKPRGKRKSIPDACSRRTDPIGEDRIIRPARRVIATQADAPPEIVAWIDTVWNDLEEALVSIAEGEIR